MAALSGQISDGRLLTRETEIIACIVGADGRLVLASPRYVKRLGRDLDGIIGHDWREWTPERDIAAAERLAATILAGQPGSRIVTSIRPDGGMAISQALFVPTRLAGNRMGVFSVHSALFLGKASAERLPARARDVADYVSSLTAELASLADGSGLLHLSDALDAIASQASDVAAALRHAVTDP